MKRIAISSETIQQCLIRGRREVGNMIRRARRRHLHLRRSACRSANPTVATCEDSACQREQKIAGRCGERNFGDCNYQRALSCALVLDIRHPGCGDQSGRSRQGAMQLDALAAMHDFGLI